MWGIPTLFHRKNLLKKILRKDEYWNNQLAKAIWWIRWPQIKQYTITNFFIYVSNQKFKQSVWKSLTCQTISKQFARANKRPKLNNPLREQVKTLFLHGKLVSSKVCITYSRCLCNKLWPRLECLNI